MAFRTNKARVIELVDETMSFDEAATSRCLKIAFLCTQQCIQDRPTLSCTFSMLSNSTITIPAAAGRPGYRDDGDDTTSQKNHLSTSCVSITTSLTSHERRYW